MVDTDWKNKMMSSESPKLSSKLHVTIPSPFKVVAVSSPISCSAPVACSAYELYLRLPELKTSGHHVTSSLVKRAYPQTVSPSSGDQFQIGFIRLLRRETVHQPPRMEPAVGLSSSRVRSSS
ncbi:hypothetical protein Bca52824_044815 [Brassica carinata]|uniref:Nematode resistance protein-like HSPRO1 N-terminal domain-containing protein n=1 Tax=Brassica carinata TaxID=52824 RepID=A0A8X7UPM3_BRACI|nr:hypothetical protein Bca52824_044815 [Brassica carinata]